MVVTDGKTEQVSQSGLVNAEHWAERNTLVTAANFKFPDIRMAELFEAINFKA